MSILSSFISSLRYDFEESESLSSTSLFFVLLFFFPLACFSIFRNFISLFR